MVKKNAFKKLLDPDAELDDLRLLLCPKTHTMSNFHEDPIGSFM